MQYKSKAYSLDGFKKRQFYSENIFLNFLDLGSVWIELILLKLKTENTVTK